MSFPTSRRHILLRRLGAMCGALVMTFSGVAAIVGFQVAGSARAGATGSLTPTISNLPSSATPGGSFTPAISTSSGGVTSVTSSTPAICSVNQDGIVSYLAAGTCSLTSHVAATQITIASEFSSPVGVAVDASGNVYVADSFNNRVVEVAPDGTQTTIGSGFSFPQGVAVDASGNVYVADTGHNQIEKVAPTGTQTTIGSGFSSPVGVAVVASGAVYVGDAGNNRVVDVAPDGTQTTIGSGFIAPQAVAVDASGNVYVVDTANNRVEEVTPPADGAMQSFSVAPVEPSTTTTPPADLAATGSNLTAPTALALDLVGLGGVILRRKRRGARA